MRVIRRKLEEVLWAFGLHEPAQSVFRSTIGRGEANRRSGIAKFYSELLTRDSLVFDIGANVGVLADIFSNFCDKVVAVEPNPDCVRHIELCYSQKNVEVIQAAVGDKDGLAVLFVSDERDDISSLSDEWITTLKREHQEYQHLWTKRITVPMLTLDTLIAQFGKPKFIKIDVEGFEEPVLDGLSSQPPLLSFEFNMAFFEAALKCLDKPVFCPASRFNFAMGDPVRFELNEWVSKSRLKEILSGIGKGDVYGDVFVKLDSQQKASSN